MKRGLTWLHEEGQAAGEIGKCRRELKLYVTMRTGKGQEREGLRA